MFALLQAHCQNNRIELPDFFRAAYLKKYNGKEMPPNALKEDVRHFLQTHNTPNYAIEFLIGIYGVQ